MYMLVYFVFNILSGQNWDSTKCTYNSYMLVYIRIWYVFFGPFFWFAHIGQYCLYMFVYECKFVRSFIIRCQCICPQNLYNE
jgi:hypothetical protein